MGEHREAVMAVKTGYLVKVQFALYSNEWFIPTDDPVRAVTRAMQQYNKEALDPVKSPNISLALCESIGS